MLKGYRAELDGSNYIDYSYSYIGLSSRKVANIEAVRASAETNMLHTYDASGNLVKLENQHNENHDADELSANERTTNFSYNTQGQVLRKTTHKQGEFDADNTPTQRAQNFFFAKGSQIASSGNLDTNSVDQIFQPISQAYPGSAPGQYTVQHASETLESIANTLWGDASLWYLLADANGLGGSYSLYQGKTLIVPNSAVEAKNSHETFKPYNPAMAIGDTMPVMPEPAIAAGGGSSCGAAEILMTVVAVAVTMWTAGAAAQAFFGAAGGWGSIGASVLAGGTTGAAAGLGAGAIATSAFIGGTVGNLASQAVAIGTGLQDGFDNKAAFTGGLETMVTAASGNLFGKGLIGNTMNAMGYRAVNKAMGNEVSKHFDWRSVGINTVSTIITPTASDSFKKNHFMAALAYNTVTTTAVNYNLSQRFNRGGAQDYVQVAINSFGQSLINELAASTGDWMSTGASDIAAKSELVGGDSAQNATDPRLLLADAGAVMREWELSPEEQVAQTVLRAQETAIEGTTIRNDAQTQQNRLFELRENINSGNASAEDRLEFHDLLLDMSAGTEAGNNLANRLSERPDLHGTAVSGRLTLEAYNAVRQQDPEIAAIFNRSLTSTNDDRSRQLLVVRDGREVAIDFRADATDYATGNVVGADGKSGSYTVDAALAQVHPDVYKSLINAAFKTSNVTAVEINGGFRPIGAVSKQGPGHPSGAGLDLSSITYNNASGISTTVNLVAPNRGQGMPGSNQPEIVKQFSNNLFQQPQVEKILQPWEYVYKKTMNNFKINEGQTRPLLGHRNHLHFELYQPYVKNWR